MFLANAPIPASSDSNVELVLISAGVVLVTAVLGFILIQVAKSRGRRNRDLLLAVTILWGLALAGSVSYFTMKQMDWSASHQQDLLSGYGDPGDLSDKPKNPAPLWAGFSAGYVAMLAWAALPTKPTGEG